MRQRDERFDIMRVLACMMIVGIHAPLPSGHADGLFLAALSYLTVPGLCLFFVISGALLLPVRTDTRTFLRKRLGRVITPTLVFTGVYCALNHLSGQAITWRCLFSLPFSPQGHGILWFMYTLVGLYLAAPILSRWLVTAGKREVEFYLLLWGVTLCYPLLRRVVDINESTTGILYYFSGFIGYFVLGYYLKQYPSSVTWQKLTIPLMLAVAAPVVCKLVHAKVDFYDLFWHLSVFVAILCCCMYVTVCHIKLSGHRIRGLVRLTSRLSFGIYLIHIAVMRWWIWKWEWVQDIGNYPLQWLVIVVLTFLISWICAYLISRTPLGNLIIGYQDYKQTI